METDQSANDSEFEAHVLDWKYRVARGLSDLQAELKDLQANLKSLEIEPVAEADARTSLAEMLRTHVDVIDAQFAYLVRLLDSRHADTFDVNLSGQPGDTVQEIVTSARNQFLEVVADAPDAVADDALANHDWNRFYGSGFGHSYGPAIRYLAKWVQSDVQRDLDDADVDVTLHDEQAATQAAERQPERVNTGEDITDTSSEETASPAKDEGESTSGASKAEANDHRESPASKSSGGDDSDTPRVSDEDEFLTTPEGKREPLATDTRLPKGDFTVVDVEYSMVLDPPCKYAGCPNEGRYLVTVEDDEGIEHTARLCSNDLPEQAEALAEGNRLWKVGRMQTKGDTFSLIEVSNPGSGGYEWREEHAVSQGDDQRDPLAYLTYKLQGQKVYISVMDYAGDHRREGQYSVEIDEWQGTVPIIEGQPIGEWLISRAKTHRKRLLENEGVKRHLVSIDHDQCVLSRAQQAYREKNPDFSQPAGMINDHTPVADWCIPVCSNCGEVVAGVTPDDAEPCEYCGCEEAEWAEEEPTDTTSNPEASA